MPRHKHCFTLDTPLDTSKPNMRSDWQHTVIDLTHDADEEYNARRRQSLPVGVDYSARHDVSLPPVPGLNPRVPAPKPTNVYYPPPPGSSPQYVQAPSTNPAVRQQAQTLHENMRPTVARPISAITMSQNNGVLVSSQKHNGYTYDAPFGADRAAKRAKIEPTGPPSFTSNRTLPAQQTSSPSFHAPQNANYFGAPFGLSWKEDKDASTANILTSDVAGSQQPTGNALVNHQSVLASDHFRPTAPTAESTMPAMDPFTTRAKRRKTVHKPFDTAQDHLLIFLKEIKQYKWSEITAEYNKDMPYREYTTLQSRYSTVLNKRDRSQDPPTLVLPPRFAAEASIDWSRIHGNRFVAPKTQSVQQTIEYDYSSGGDSALSRERPRRAQRINYTWPKQRIRAGDVFADDPTDEHADEHVFGEMFNDTLPTRSETPEDDSPPPDTAFTVDNDPVEVEFNAGDAKLVMDLYKNFRDAPSRLVPYLSISERKMMQNPPGFCWDQLSSRKWQGSLLHVDFSPAEIKIVKKTIVSIKRPLQLRHSTKRRQLRELLKGFSEPKMLKLVEVLRQRLPCRDRSSIEAFVEDAQDGQIPEVSHVQRLAAARPDVSMSSTQKPSTTSIIRQRELGCQSRRGWQAAAKPLTYQVKNQIMDTIGPSAFWTGASSDIHTVAWAPDGERFAAGAVAVDDPDSMQYNRPNNLLYGNMIHGSIHELAEHYRKRERTEAGANSSHAMFASQDPKLYSTVSSVAFSTSGRYLYSAGYDSHIGIWYTEGDVVQPILGAKLNVKDPIDILSVNRSNAGVLATAARVARRSIRVLRINEEDPSKFDKFSYESVRANERPDLKILPTATQFEPKYGGLLLAGFGANLKETGFDTTGDLCLWDIQAESALPIHGSSKNVFDVAFNPNRSWMPYFAAGCVAGGGKANGGMRSCIRLYDINSLNKFTSPMEFDCKALDINDVIWCPHDEHLIAAGCTDGRVYVWDGRWPDDPLRVVSHGRSLMPLQEGVKHEITDTGVRFLSWGENATRLYSGSSDGVVKVWDVTRAKEDTFIKDVITTNSGIMSGAFNADYSKLIIGEVNGSANVLEVGRDDVTPKDAEKLRYLSYQDHEQDEIQDHETGEMTVPVPESGIAEARHLLGTGQMQLAPMGGFPIRQAVQGPQYMGPFDQSVDAPFLRQQALELQLDLAIARGLQCDIAACRENLIKTTSEEVGDSGRSGDRVPDELRLQWKTVDTTHIIPGKSRCTQCGRPARPATDSTSNILCERCSFACFRCNAVNAVDPATTTLVCSACGGVWDIGVLGYECVQQPAFKGEALNVPNLKKWGKEVHAEKLEAFDTDFGDDMNALTDYYYSLAITEPENPPL